MSQRENNELARADLMHLSSFSLMWCGRQRHRDGINTNPPPSLAFASILKSKSIIMIENLCWSGKSSAMFKLMKDAIAPFFCLLFLHFLCLSSGNLWSNILWIPTLHHFQLVSSPSHFVLCPSFPICKADCPWQLIQADAVRSLPPSRYWWTWQGKTTSNAHFLSFCPT